VAWWPGDGNGDDIIGGNNGTLLSNATANATGMVGQAFSFDGVNAVVSAGTNGFFDFNDGSANFSIEGWVKPSALPSFSTGFASKSLGNFDGWVFGIFWDGALMFSGCGNWYVSSRPVVLATGVWSHVAVTLTAGTYTLYLNGSQVYSGAGGTWSGSTAALRFGTNPPRQNYSGLLDELSMYNRALSSNEVAAIYAAGSAGKCHGPAIISIAMYAGVTFSGVVGQTYGVQYTSDLSNTNGWVGVTNITMTASTCLWYDSQSAGLAQRFYRVVLGPISIP
jgi:hypothetical protein